MKKNPKEFAFYLSLKRENPKLEMCIMEDSAKFKVEVHQIRIKAFSDYKCCF